MDPFNDQLDDEDEDEMEDETPQGKSMDSRHSNYEGDGEFNRVSLPAFVKTPKGSEVEEIEPNHIKFELDKEESKGNHLGLNGKDDGIDAPSNSGTNDELDQARRRRAGFGDQDDSDDDEDPDRKNKGKGNQGTILGVFFPCLQSIIGIILFLRLPQITGEAGLLQTYIIICLGTAVTFLTTLSMNAMCTNGKMSKGGAYFLLSRSLGPATGGALGLLFYMATTISGAMYILGSVETFVVATGFGIGISGFTIRVLSFLVLIVILSITWVGISYVSKTSLVFLSVTIVSIFSIFVGMLFSNLRENSLPDGITGLSFSNFAENFNSGYKKDSSFFILLSIFFPACTGIMTGSNRSGDLREPSKSIPKGTLAAQVTTTIGYYVFVFMFACVAKKSALKDDNMIFVAEVAWPFKFLIHAGVIFSSLGAALQNLASSPRLLTAIASDDLIPFLKIFSKNQLFPLLLNAFICFIAI